MILLSIPSCFEVSLYANCPNYKRLSCVDLLNYEQKSSGNLNQNISNAVEYLTSQYLTTNQAGFSGKDNNERWKATGKEEDQI